MDFNNRAIKAFGTTFLVTLLCGCAVGQRVEYRREISVPELAFSKATPISIEVIDARPTVVNGSVSPSNVGIQRSIAGVPWAVHTASKRPLAQDLEEGLIRGLESRGYVVSQADRTGDSASKKTGNVLVAGSSIFNFLLREWQTESWFSTVLKYCVELRLVNHHSAVLAQASECDNAELRVDNAPFSSLDRAVDTVFQRLLLAEPVQEIGRSAASTVIAIADAPSAMEGKSAKGGCTAEQMIRMKRLALSTEQILSACD